MDPVACDKPRACRNRASRSSETPARSVPCRHPRQSSRRRRNGGRRRSTWWIARRHDTHTGDAARHGPRVPPAPVTTGRAQPFRRRHARRSRRLGSVDPVNRLAAETSPYLRQHRDNPVDWYPWGADAFAEARRRDVPVLLSVGYSACHWCHVMAHECFEDADGRRRDEPPVRQRQGRPRGAPRRRRRLHGRRAGDDRPRRLADDGVHDGRRRAVLRRHVLPEAELPAADGGHRRRLGEPPRRGHQERRRPARGGLAHGPPAPGRRAPGRRPPRPDGAGAGRRASTASGAASARRRSSRRR